MEYCIRASGSLVLSMWAMLDPVSYTHLNRVASTRGVPPEKIRKLVSEHVVRGGILGENVVNVMTLNAALDTLLSLIHI